MSSCFSDFAGVPPMSLILAWLTEALNDAASLLLENCWDAIKFELSPPICAKMATRFLALSRSSELSFFGLVVLNIWALVLICCEEFKWLLF